MSSHELNQPTMNASDLYMEEIFTDRRVGAIKRLTPVDSDGQPDLGREVIYSGETQIVLGNNPLPINFEIDAKSLGEAAEKFADAAQEAAQDTLKRLKELQREMQSSIVVPGQEGMGGPASMTNIPGAGKLQIP